MLDSDDYFNKEKIEKIVDYFENNKKAKIVFDYPLIVENNNVFSDKTKNKIFKTYWPYIHPTSCISLKREFFKNLIENKILDKYPLLEIDFRITILSRMIDKKFIYMNENHTIYRQVPDGIMGKIKKFSYLWWKKRFQAHSYLEHVFNTNNLDYKRNVDYYLSKLVFNLMKIFNIKK